MKSLKTWLTGTCVAFTAITLIILALNSGNTESPVSVVMLLLILPCALLMSAASMLRHNPDVPRWIAILGHYIINVLSVFIFLYLPNAAQGAARLVMFFLLSVLYWIIFGVCALISSRIKILKEKD